jgi:hypothetical protein
LPVFENAGEGAVSPLPAWISSETAAFSTDVLLDGMHPERTKTQKNTREKRQKILIMLAPFSVNQETFT